MIMKFNNLKDLDEKSLLDKKQRKEYTKLKEQPAHASIFDDDAVADSAVDYLYSKDNQSKTQSFLKNSGFPSLQDRDFNKQLYGISEEQRQLRDMLKSKTNSILNAKLPTETDRAFLHGLMGEKAGEDDYQKQISDTNRAKDDLLSAFRNTPFESGLKPIVSDATAHTSVIDSPQRQAMAQSAAKSMPPSGLQNKEYDNKNFWYIDGSGNPTPPNIPSPFDKPMPSDKPKAPNNSAPASNPNITNKPTPSENPGTTYGPPPPSNPGSTSNASENTKKPQEPKPKAVRTNVENAGGSVTWNPENNTATIKINGYTEDFYVGDGNGTFIQDGVMYTDSLHLDNLVHAPLFGLAKTIYDDIKDDFGKFVLRTWFFGDGSEVHVSGERWNSFIKNNPKVQEIFEKTVRQNISKGNTSFDIKESVALSEDGNGGYTSGDELINGSNHNVGGFALQGNISSMGNGKYKVTLNYTLNDIIDPNKEYRTDRQYSAAADFFNVTGKDYTLRISGTVTFIYSNHGGLLEYV